MTKKIYTKKQYLKAKRYLKKWWAVPEEAFDDKEQTVKRPFSLNYLYGQWPFEQRVSVKDTISEIFYCHMDEEYPDYELVASLL